ISTFVARTNRRPHTLSFSLSLYFAEPIFYFTKGQRKSIKLNFGGHSYVKFMENSRGTKWICATRSTTKCRARVRTKDNALEVLHEAHNHQMSKRQRERAKSRRTLS
ncbi:uncharacterized protein pre-mod(mdg4)-U, partial [Drosophila virilis]